MKQEGLIEKYFSKQLSESELSEFKKFYETDFDFKEEVDFLKDVQSVSETEDDAQFKKQLTSYETEFSQKKEVSSSKWLKPSIAVAAVLLIALSLTFFLNENHNKDALFVTYFEPSKNVSAPIVRSESDDQLINNAFIAYSEGDYKKAIPLLSKAFESTKNSELLFYEANALLALNKTEEAIKVFKEHLSYSDSLTTRSHWYLALAYLKSNQLEQAKHELKTFSRFGESFKKKEAISLLKQLD